MEGSISFQTLAVIVAVTVAGSYLLAKGVRVLQVRNSDCAGGCGCSATAKKAIAKPASPKLIPSEDLVLRRRD